jgi:hypothetical protein
MEKSMEIGWKSPATYSKITGREEPFTIELFIWECAYAGESYII